MGTITRAVALGAALLAAMLAASTASAAVTGTLTCSSTQAVTLTVGGLTPNAAVTVQEILKGSPGDPAQYVADATGTLQTTLTVGFGAFPVAVHAADDTTGLGTTTPALTCGGKPDCMQGGFDLLGFRNQGQCVSFFEELNKK